MEVLMLMQIVSTISHDLQQVHIIVPIINAMMPMMTLLVKIHNYRCVEFVWQAPLRSPLFDPFEVRYRKDNLD